ncbi:hypothetical protein V2G26_020837 [Clonostachys chloroleuca]
MTPSRLLSRIWVIRPYISGSQLLEIGKYRVEDRLHLASSCWPPTRAPFFSLFWGVVAIRASAQYLDDQDPAISRVDHAKHVRGAKTRDLSERAHDLPVETTKTSDSLRQHTDSTWQQVDRVPRYLRNHSICN